jgi:hypothetical protein
MAKGRRGAFVINHSGLKDRIPRTIIVEKMAEGSSTIGEISV